jgi:hypothetical protein
LTLGMPFDNRWAWWSRPDGFANPCRAWCNMSGPSVMTRPCPAGVTERFHMLDADFGKHNSMNRGRGRSMCYSDTDL